MLARLRDGGCCAWVDSRRVKLLEVCRRLGRSAMVALGEGGSECVQKKRVVCLHGDVHQVKYRHAVVRRVLYAGLGLDVGYKLMSVGSRRLRIPGACTAGVA